MSYIRSRKHAAIAAALAMPATLMAQTAAPAPPSEATQRLQSLRNPRNGLE